MPRVKRTTILIAAVSFLLIAYILYGSLESSHRQRYDTLERNNVRDAANLSIIYLNNYFIVLLILSLLFFQLELEKLENKLTDLELELKHNEKKMQNVRAVLQNRLEKSQQRTDDKSIKHAEEENTVQAKSATKMVKSFVGTLPNIVYVEFEALRKNRCQFTGNHENTNELLLTRFASWPTHIRIRRRTCKLANLFEFCKMNF
jgi:hypothetical protein